MAADPDTTSPATGTPALRQKVVAQDQTANARQHQEPQEHVGRPGVELRQRAVTAVEPPAAHGVADALGALLAAHEQRSGDVAERAVAVPAHAIAVAAGAQGNAQ